MPCEVKGGKAFLGGMEVKAANAREKAGGRLELGIRPEFVRFTKKGLPVDVVRVSDIGRYRVVETRLAQSTVKLVVPEGEDIPERKAQLAFDPAHTFIYADGWIAEAQR
jgi:glycerol transport system ATP-binding protein